MEKLVVLVWISSQVVVAAKHCIVVDKISMTPLVIYHKMFNSRFKISLRQQFKCKQLSPDMEMLITGTDTSISHGLGDKQTPLGKLKC